MNLLHHLVRNAQLHPQRIAICERKRGKDSSISYAQLYARLSAVSQSLRSSGNQRGDRILLLLPVGIDLYVVLLGCIHAGLVPVLLDPSAGVDKMKKCLEIAKIKAFIGIPKAHLLRLTIPSLRSAQAYSYGRYVPFSQRLASLEAAVEPDDVANDAPALLTFTSGSTGQPKAAVRTHGFLLAQDAALRNAISLESGEVDLVTLPVFALANLSAGLTSVIADTALAKPGETDCAAIVRQCSDWRVTRCSASPAFFEGLLRGGMPLLHKIFTGGAPVFPDLLERLQARLPKARVTSVYGSTEAEPIADAVWKNQSFAYPSQMGLRAGIPVQEISVKIIADQWGKPLGPWSSLAFSEQELRKTEVGEIIVAGKHVLPSYLDGRGDEETKIHVAGDVWHRTGDAGYFAEDGTLWLVGRCSAKLPARESFPALYPLIIEAYLRSLHHEQRAIVMELGDERVWVYEAGWTRELVDKATNELVKHGIYRAIQMEKIPVDQRHQAKVDYVALARILDENLSARRE